ncbi:MAG: methyltransferase domain-containing protein [Halobacteriota archaeon]
MIKKISAKLKSEGISGLFLAVYRRVLPSRLAYYQHCRPFFQDKIGLEIGGPSGIFRRYGLLPVYAIAARIDNCNFGNQTIWEGTIKQGATFHYDKQHAPGDQYVTEATNLSCIASSAYDFILSSHTLEHVANPLQALSEWIRVLKEQGLLVLVVPHKDGTFDHRRPVTSLAHMIQDFEQQSTEEDVTHLEEILKLHDLALDPEAGDFKEFKQRSERNLQNRTLHHHVFDTRLAVEIIHHMGLQILAVEVLPPYHIFLIAKKLMRGEEVQNDRFRRTQIAPVWRSPFPSDQLSISTPNDITRHSTGWLWRAAE